MKPVEIAWTRFKHDHNTSFRAIAFRASISYDHFWANIVHEKRHSPNRELVEHILQKNDATREETFYIMWASGYVQEELRGMELNTDTLLLMHLLSTPIGSIQDELLHVMQRVHISMNRWANEAHVDPSMLSRSIGGQRHPTKEFLDSLCNMPFITEIDRARILWSAGYVPTLYFDTEPRIMKATQHQTKKLDPTISPEASVQETQ